ncbi:MAG: hypothetical protein QNK89_09095, partial [Lacinutrix sp.]|uniref:OB-fold protein n=1 Tax=Lacinutrix sp. TaxID=1937692 RepID=UPI0030AC507C
KFNSINMKKKYLILLLLVATIGIIVYNYVYQNHRDISSESADFSSTSTILLNKFLNDSQTAETKYLNKTIKITGQVSEINTTDVTLDDAIFCSLLNKENKQFKLNQTVTIKGRCIGYDDLLEQIKLDQCTLTN